MMLAPKSGPQIAAKVGNPAGLLCRRIWYSVGKSGVLGITEYRHDDLVRKWHPWGVCVCVCHFSPSGSIAKKKQVTDVDTNFIS